MVFLIHEFESSIQENQMDDKLFNLCLREITQNMEPFKVGTLMVKISIFRKEYLPEIKTSPHEHAHYEFLFLQQNDASYEIMDNNIKLKNDGNCIFIPSTINHLRCSNDITRAVSAHLIIEPVMQENISDLILFREEIIKRKFKFKLSEEFMQILEELQTIIEKKSNYWIAFAECKLKELFLHFFLTNFPDLPKKKLQIHNSKNIETIGKLLYQISVIANLPLDTKQHAKLIGLSERHLSRLVHEEFGMPLGKFILTKRMEYAKSLLSANKQLIKDVAATVGFLDPSHFSRIFQKFYGMTPKQYVQQTKQNRSTKEKIISNVPL